MDLYNFSTFSGGGMCTSNRCGVNRICVPVDFDYTCVCAEGFELNGTNECIPIASKIFSSSSVLLKDGTSVGVLV